MPISYFNCRLESLVPTRYHRIIRERERERERERDDFKKDIGLNNILFKVLLTYYDIFIHTIFLGFDGKC